AVGPEAGWGPRSTPHSRPAIRAGTTTWVPGSLLTLGRLQLIGRDKGGVVGHGAPLRLRNETQLGFKQVKWIKGIEFVADFADIGGGYGGYHQDQQFLGTP